MFSSCVSRLGLKKLNQGQSDETYWVDNLNKTILGVCKELIEVEKGIEEVEVILSFSNRLRIENRTREIARIMAKIDIEVRQHIPNSIILIIIVTKIEGGITGSSGFEIWHAMIDISRLNSKLARIEVSSDASRAGTIVTATSHTTFLFRRLARLVLIAWMSQKVLLFECISCVLEMSLGLFGCQLPLLSKDDCLQEISKLHF